MSINKEILDLKDKGNKFYLKGEYEESIRVYTEILNNEKINNDYSELLLQVLLNRSASYIKLKEYEKGLQDCNKVLLKDEKNIKGLYRRALCLLNMNINLDQAIDDLKKAYYIEKDNVVIKELLQNAYELKNKEMEKIEFNKLPNEMLKCIIDILVKDKGICFNNIKEINEKWQNFYNYLIKNGKQDIIINKCCIKDMIYILENSLYYLDIDEKNLEYLDEKLCYSLILNSWNILRFLVEDNDLIVDDSNNYNINIISRMNAMNFYEDNKDLNVLRMNIRENKKIINYEYIKELIFRILDVKKMHDKKISSNSRKILSNIFSVLISINNQDMDGSNDINLLIILIENSLPRINMNSDDLNVLISLILRNLSILFRNRKSKGLKIKALEYTREIGKLINCLFSLSYEYYKLLFSLNKLGSNKYDINDNDYNKIIQNCEFILTLLFSLLSEKERKNDININSIIQDHVITKYIFKSITRYEDMENKIEEVKKSDEKNRDSFSNWIVFDYINFITGLMGLKILHFSNRDILKTNILNYPQIIHCILLIVITNNKEYNSLLNHSLKDNSNFSSYPLDERIYDVILKFTCVEMLSFLMEYREIRISIVKDEDTIILLYNICKYIINSEYDLLLRYSKSEKIHFNKLDSACRLLNGISKATMESNDILLLFINQLNIMELLEKLWSFFKYINNLNFSENGDYKYYYNSIQNSFEILTILSMHGEFKLKLLKYTLKDYKSNHKTENCKNIQDDTDNNLFILNLLNISDVCNFKSNKYLSHSFTFLYIIFIQNLLTSNESDPSSEGSRFVMNEEIKEQKTYFLKRQRYYCQYETDNYVDFDQSQLEQLEIMYKKLPEYTRNERNGHYNRGDEILANSFRNLILEKSNVVNFMYVILDKNLNNKILSETSMISLSLILNIANNICDLIVNNELITNENSKLILSYRGKIIQSGGLKCLLDIITIIDNELNVEMNNKKKNKEKKCLINIQSFNKKYLSDRLREYKQAISRLLMYISPNLISYELLLESAIKIQSLLDDEHELLQYESALAITNILSKSFDKLSQGEGDSLSVRIYNNGIGWSLLKNLCFSDNTLLRSAGLEGLCNFCNKDHIVLNHFINSKSKGIEDLKLFAAFSMEDNIRIQIASLGALAMLSSYSDVSRIIIENWDCIGQKLIQLSQESSIHKNIELKERILFCFNNFLLFISSQNNNNNNNNNDSINNEKINEADDGKSMLGIYNLIKENISFLT